MRHKPVRREEIRLHPGYGTPFILTLPSDSVRKRGAFDYEPIKALWAPLLRALNQEQKKKWDDAAEWRADRIARGLSAYTVTTPPEKIGYPQPRLHGRSICQRCGRSFYTAAHPRKTLRSSYCSDACANYRRNAKQVQKKAKARAAVRAELTCGFCGAPLDAKRSSRKFCSTKHRVAAHRQRQASHERP